MESETPPTSKRWIWITAAAVAFLGLFSWLYLRDDELLPDGDLIRERAAFTEEENGYALVMGLREEVWFDGSDFWLELFKMGRESWDGERAKRMLDGQDAVWEVLRALSKKRVIAQPVAGSNDFDEIEYFRILPYLENLIFLTVRLAAQSGDRSKVLDGLRTGRSLAAQLEAGDPSPSELLQALRFRNDVLRAVEALTVSNLSGDTECRKAALEGWDGWAMETLWRDSMLSEYRSFKDELREMKADGRIRRWISCCDSWALASFRLKVNRTTNLAATDVRNTLSAQATTWQEWKSRIPGVRKTTPLRMYAAPNGTGEVVLGELSPANPGVLLTMLQLKSRMEMSRALLALRDYQEKHGVLPATLDELVPDYLEAVPKDWMDGQAIRYDPARGVLWSIGRNLEDDGGQPQRTGVDCVRIPWVVPPEDGE